MSGIFKRLALAIPNFTPATPTPTPTPTPTTWIDEATWDDSKTWKDAP